MFEIISIGSATKDVFVFIHPKVFKGDICFLPGSKIEAKKISVFTGGGATNTIVGFKKMGLKTGIIAVIGKDKNGEAIEKELKKEKISTKYLIKSKTKKTHYSVILTGFHRDRVILTYRGATGSIKDLNSINWKKIKTKWIHLTSLHGSFNIVKKIINSFHSNNTKISWNPGKKELKLGLKKLTPLLKKTRILVLNETEAQTLTRQSNLIKNLKSLQKIVPIIVITSGKKGAHVFNGKEMLYCSVIEKKVLDATGAGDAFSTGFVTAIIKQKTLKTALRWGMIQSQSIIKYLGTKNKLLTEKEIKQFIKKHEKKIKIKTIKFK